MNRKRIQEILTALELGSETIPKSLYLRTIQSAVRDSARSLLRAIGSIESSLAQGDYMSCAMHTADAANLAGKLHGSFHAFEVYKASLES